MDHAVATAGAGRRRLPRRRKAASRRGQGAPRRAQGRAGRHAPARARRRLRPALASPTCAPCGTELADEETRVSYWRRIIQARLDVVPSDLPEHDPVADLVARALRRHASYAAGSPTSTVHPIDDRAAAARPRRDLGAPGRPRRRRARWRGWTATSRGRAASCRRSAATCTGASTGSPPSSSRATASSRCWRCRSCRTDPLHRHRRGLTARRVRTSGTGTPDRRPARGVQPPGRGIGHTVPCRSPPRPDAAVQGGPTWTTCS